MAEEDAEIALLHQMQSGQESVAWESDGANGDAEGEIPSNTEHNNHHEVKKEVVADDQVLRALSPSSADAVSDGGEYDPSSVTALPAVAIAGEDSSRSSSRASNRKRKTVGGFIADDSDEEADASTGPTSSSLLQPPAPNVSKRAPSPLQTSVTQQDLQGAPENQGDSTAVPQTSHTLSVNSSSAGVPFVQAPATQVLTSAGTSAQGVSVPKARLPNDKTGILEDKIKEDPRGALDSWLALIEEHKSRNKLDEARAVYDRFFKVFPQAAEIWVAYAEMELEHDNRNAAEQIFGKSLLSVPNVQLWSVYLNYIRRVNDLTNDVSGNARQTIAQSYDFVLANIGSDRDSGKIWTDYIQFIRSAPGQIGGTTWQDQQKMDQLRKAYQRAICVPMSSVNNTWKEYDAFEMSLNKMTGRKFLQEKSPAYMSARSANTAIENITRGLIRTTLPKLPPVHGFDGEVEFNQQVELWNKWLSWEKDDPLVLKAEELEAYKARVLYLYKQAVMALRFWPEIWVDAAEWCFSNGVDKEGDTFLNDGITANPESCLLAFKKADRLEATLTTDGAAKGPAEQGAAVRAPFDKLLDTLYDLITGLKAREAAALVKLDEEIAVDASISAIVHQKTDDEGEDEADKKAREEDKANRTKAIQRVYEIQTDLISRTISYSWVALMRAMRRVQGKGAVKDAVGGSRQIFADARARGRITSDVYVASALIEHHVYKDPAGTKIFERGAKLFPWDTVFILEYLKHLLSIGDTTNARVAFETAVNRIITKKPELVGKAKVLYSYFHKYESQYGELSQIQKLELRMAELYPEDPKLTLFASRSSGESFDPTAVRPIISPETQMRTKSSNSAIIMPSIEQYTEVQNSPRPNFAQQDNTERSPRPTYMQTTNSPKRPLPFEDMDDFNRPRKLARGESPLKGAAGRRLGQQKRMHGTPNNWESNAPPFVVPRDITFLLSIIPRAELYQSTKFDADALVRLLTQTHIPDHTSWKTSREQPQPQSQRYDGRTSATSTQRPQSRDQRASYTSYAGQDDGQGYNQPPQAHAPPTGYGNAPSYGVPAPGYGTPSYSAAPAPAPGYSGYSGAPAPGYAYQQAPPPQPDSSRAGYYGTGSGAPGTENRGWPQPPSQGPSLSGADSWYYPPANQPAPGYPSYGR